MTPKVHIVVVSREIPCVFFKGSLLWWADICKKLRRINPSLHNDYIIWGEGCSFFKTWSQSHQTNVASKCFRPKDFSLLYRDWLSKAMYKWWIKVMGWNQKPAHVRKLLAPPGQVRNESFQKKYSKKHRCDSLHMVQNLRYFPAFLTQASYWVPGRPGSPKREPDG